MKRIDWFAVLAFALAAVWVFGLGSLAALYVARLSFRRMKRSPELLGRTVAWTSIAVSIFGLAVAALWLGLSLAA